MCEKTHFKCPKTANTTSICIDSVKKCDGTKNCAGGEDEQDCPVKVCTSSHFKCGDQSKCIPKVWICDGDRDCPDGTDEMDCQTRSCPLNEFKCSNGRCIPNSWKCDSECKLILWGFDTVLFISKCILSLGCLVLGYFITLL